MENFDMSSLIPASRNTAAQGNEEDVTTETNIEEVEEDEAVDGVEPDTEQSEAEEPTESELDVLNKRLKDTQSAFNKERMVLARIEKKLANGEELSAEDLATWKSKSVEEMTAEDNPFVEINEQIQQQVQMNEKLLRSTFPDIEDRLNGFQLLFQSDPAVGQELVNKPADERLMYMLEKGLEATPITSAISEHGNVGSALTAMQSRIAELEAQLSASDTPSTKKEVRPNLSGTKKTTSKPVNDGNFNVKNLLGR